MLKPAYIYSQELNDLWANNCLNHKYAYWDNGWYTEYTINIDKDSWSKLQFVSVDKDNKVIGYLAAHICRQTNHVTNLSIINFNDKNITFSKDLRSFLVSLFESYNFNKICFNVVVGNPAEKMYDKYIERYGGRIVGTFKNDVKLNDGLFYDFKWYEIFKEDYMKRKNTNE